MAGRPLHRARVRAGLVGGPDQARRELGLVERFGVAPRPEDWLAKSIAGRLEANLGLSIERCYDVLSWPLDRCDHHMLAYQKEVAIAHIKAGFRYMLDRANSDDRERILDQMRKELTPDPEPDEDAVQRAAKDENLRRSD